MSVIRRPKGGGVLLRTPQNLLSFRLTNFFTNASSSSSYSQQRPPPPSLSLSQSNYWRLIGRAFGFVQDKLQRSVLGLRGSQTSQHGSETTVTEKDLRSFPPARRLSSINLESNPKPQTPNQTKSQQSRMAAKSEATKKKDDYPSQIEEDLYLGSLLAAKNKWALTDLQITHILTVANDEEAEPAYPTEFIYKRIQVVDKSKINLTQYFSECFDFIDEARKTMGGRVLVHCIGGMSRSVSIVIAYLMKTSGMTFSQAFEYVKSKRPQASPNDGFKLQLKDFEKSLSLQANEEDVKKTRPSRKEKKKM